jgi:hypothetical protein
MCIEVRLKPDTTSAVRSQPYVVSGFIQTERSPCGVSGFSQITGTPYVVSGFGQTKGSPS